MVTAAGDWPTYLHDNQRRDANIGETALSPGSAAHLALLWAYATHGVISASATVVDGTVYVGSWDGYEYALNAATGALRWKTYLGQTPRSISLCAPPTGMGIASTATVLDGMLYVGGGSRYWYALNARTGRVIWRVDTGDPRTGHYNWSSPLISRGYAYVGIASLCDRPLVQGRLLQVSLATHRIVRTLNLVPDGQRGATIWTSPGLDAETNTIYVTTGNEGQEPPNSQRNALALDFGSCAEGMKKGSDVR